MHVDMQACRRTSPGFVPLFSAKGSKISALLSVGFFFFWTKSLLVLPEVWRMSCFSPFSWALLVCAAFVLPFPLGVWCDLLTFTGLNVAIAGVFRAGSPSQETAASLLPECLSRVCGPEGILQPGSTVKWEFQQAEGCFITSAVCWWRSCRQRRAEIEKSWLLLK